MTAPSMPVRMEAGASTGSTLTTAIATNTGPVRLYFNH